MQIRFAVLEDADAAVDVLRRSIIELCLADHQNDPETLDGWLGNKTPEAFRGWVSSPGGRIIVALDSGDGVLGVGGFRDDGEITLNYVNPEARFQGVSTKMLVWMEACLQDSGQAECRLTSTQTAHLFYLSKGYYDVGLAEPWLGKAVNQPMEKLFLDK